MSQFILTAHLHGDHMAQNLDSGFRDLQTAMVFGALKTWIE
jgi:hypothetical protein